MSALASRRTEISARKLLLWRNIPGRMGFQRIWQPWSWTTRFWERTRLSGRTGNQEWPAD